MMLMFEHHGDHSHLRHRRGAADDGRVAPKRRVGGLFVAEHDFETLEEAGAEDGDFVAAGPGAAVGDETLDCWWSLEVEALW